MDGKQMRGSKDGPAGKEGLYMISAWAADRGIVLGQRRVDEKSNEITAIPELLDVLALEGCVVTIGRLKMTCIGCWMSLSTKTTIAFTKTMPLKTWLSYSILP